MKFSHRRAADLVQRAGNGVPKAFLAHGYGISRETVYQYLRHTKLEGNPSIADEPSRVAEAATTGMRAYSISNYSILLTTL